MKVNFPKIIDYQAITSQSSSLGIISTKDVSMKIKRVFWVTSDNAISRGGHAHKDCTQVLIPVKGSIKLIVSNPEVRHEYNLEDNKALIVPPMWWGEQVYHQNSVLLVLCDEHYDESEYIRDWEEFECIFYE